jgi:hypothetical protein
MIWARLQKVGGLVAGMGSTGSGASEAIVAAPGVVTA